MQLPQWMPSASTDWHVVQPPQGSVVKQPHARPPPAHPVGMGTHDGGTSQHPAHRPRMHTSSAAHAASPHGMSPSIATVSVDVVSLVRVSLAVVSIVASVVASEPCEVSVLPPHPTRITAQGA
jgi:hypothetical protein